MGREIEVADVKFDLIDNRLVVILSNGDKVKVDPSKIMEIMPTKDAKERVAVLQMMINYIDRQQLSQISQILTKAVKLAKGIAETRAKLQEDDCDNILCIKRHAAIAKTYVDEKNVLKELRLAVKLLSKKKMELRTEIARMGYDPDEGVKA